MKLVYFINFDSNMSMITHINENGKSAVRNPQNIHSIKKFLSREVTECLIYGFVPSQTDYDNNLPDDVGACHTDNCMLQRVQTWRPI